MTVPLRCRFFGWHEWEPWEPPDSLLDRVRSMPNMRVVRNRRCILCDRAQLLTVQTIKKGDDQ